MRLDAVSSHVRCLTLNFTRRKICSRIVRLLLSFWEVRAHRVFELDGIAASITIGVINYVLLGFQFPVDDFYMHSFEIWLATTVVFFGSGNVGFTLLEYRLGEKELVRRS